jgi:hypothetical protein
MKILAFLILSSTLTSHLALSQDLSVGVDELGNLAVQTKSIEAISSYTDKEVLAKVTVLPGQSYVFKSPINVQQIQYLKGVGDNVTKNQPFAIIQGPEVHHFYRVFQMKKVLFRQASSLFENSKALYQRKSLSEQAWLEISNQYHDTKMEFDELTHFFDLVLSADEENDALTLASPVAGVIQYNIQNALDINHTIASFTPKQAIRLKVNLPIETTQTPLYISNGNCKLAIDFVESANSAYYQSVWSKPLTTECTFAIDQILSVKPEYQIDAYKIEQSSVFNWEGDNYLFIQNKQNYEAVKVTLVTAQDGYFIVKSSVSLTNKLALVSSVSAVQGILFGLGI